MIIEEAVKKLVTSLKQDELVQAIFLKGSIGRNEHDECSDIDLYCLVDKEDLDEFLPRRLNHIRAYKELLYFDDIHIIAPQLLAVYENLVHLDLFTVTEESYIAKDYIKVLYDPDGRLDSVLHQHDLSLEESELQDAWDDTVWFLYQYYFSAKRGNDLWSIQMLNQVIGHFSKLLLHIYCPERAQLGMKTLERSLPAEPLQKLKHIYRHLNEEEHQEAARQLVEFVSYEETAIAGFVPEPEVILPLWRELKKKWNEER
ncbi:MAG: nucleotidyltransferase domain-containing protein [Lysinibacillus sp.]